MLRILSLLLLAVSLVLAQGSQTIVYPTTAAPIATAAATSHGYVYAGCWNETIHIEGTGGQRALPANASANNTMTIDSCIKYCNTWEMQYAGIEYGRECYCGQYLSTFSKKLDDSECKYACDGNASQICGGALAITLYNRTSEARTGSAWRIIGAGSGAEWYGFAGIVMLVVAGVL